jgi:hypothetical protein
LKNYVHIFLLALALVGCKKKEAEAPIDPNTGCANCTPSYATSFNGILKAGTYTTTGAAIGTTVATRVSAYFSNSTVTIPSVANSTTVSSVIFDDSTLVYSGAPYYYTNFNPVSISANSWTVTGTSALPSFTYKNLKEKPAYSSMSAWPDTLKKSVGFTFYLYDLNYVTGATVFVSDGLPSPNVVTKALGVGSDTLTFSVNDLASLGTSTNAVITLVMENAHGIKVDGKDFKVSNEASYTRKIVIKN